MNLLLSTSPHFKHSACLENDYLPGAPLMYNFVPLGLLMLCSMVREQNNIEPHLFDINKRINDGSITLDDNFYASAAQAIVETDPHIIGFMTECDSYHHVLQICAQIKKSASKCYIILGGPHATAVAKETMQKWYCIDAIVMGEGELTFSELIGNIVSGIEEAVDGAIIRLKSGEIVTGNARKLVEILDSLPFPAYDMYSPGKGEELFLEVGRGCPFQCTFCSTSPFWQRKHRTKSPERIVAELQFLKDSFAVERVHFTHDLFTANPAWVKSVCHALIKCALKVKWTCSCRVDTVNEDLLTLMKSAGCDAIYFGIESGSEAILADIDKRISKNHSLEILELCQRVGITPNAGLIIGFPQDTGDSMSQTFALYEKMLQIGVKPAHLFSFCPFVQASSYASLVDITCTEDLFDLPVSAKVDKENRQLIGTNRDLFSSYFKPSLHNKILYLKPGFLYAIDEFSLLVDCTRIPALLVSQISGGMLRLFLNWIDFIVQLNIERSRPSYKKYYGSPVDFCNFLLSLVSDHLSDSTIFLSDLIAFTKKNLEISKLYVNGYTVAMSTYRSKTIPASLSSISMTSRLHLTNVIDHMQVNFDLQDYLANTAAGTLKPANEKVNLIWLKTDLGVSLLTVNDFIYCLINKSKSKACDVKEMLDDWFQEGISKGLNPEYLDFFENISVAQEKGIITFESI